MNKLRLWRAIFLVGIFCGLAVVALPAQTFTTLASFNGTNGSTPEYGSLVQGFNGNLYGTTSNGGAHGTGTVFQITPAGQLTTIYNFCSQPNCNDGSHPYAGLALATNGNFYGTTVGGGANAGGTVFQITPAGQLTTLYSFCSQTGCTDGSTPLGGLVQAVLSGNFYGTTYLGGTSSNCTQGCGTVFKITPGGKLTTVHSFDGSDGANPHAGLMEGTNASYYGTTRAGGAHSSGTIFRITPSGTLTTLYSFCSSPHCNDGSFPFAGLVQASNGKIYGTTFNGGANNFGTIFQLTSNGTPSTPTILHSFASSDGAFLYSGLMQANDSQLYGTTSEGGAHADGTIFKITPSGTLTTLYSFCSQASCADGASAFAGLMQATNGSFYGTTESGGSDNDGTVFTLRSGLARFVETVPVGGKTGASVIVLGSNLTGATSVTFNGTPAAFTVVSNTEITTTVPSGATNGRLKVTTPSRTLTSNANFRVIP